MATLIDQESQTTSVGQIIDRGFVAAHGVLAGEKEIRYEHEQ